MITNSNLNVLHLHANQLTLAQCHARNFTNMILVSKTQPNLFNPTNLRSVLDEPMINQPVTIRLNPFTTIAFQPDPTITRPNYNPTRYELVLNKPEPIGPLIFEPNVIRPVSKMRSFQPELMNPTETRSICPN